ncbi:MAG: riboflavin synthase [Thalassobius sp.]|nr:riboflavin synthase [Thalassovita sp.]
MFTGIVESLGEVVGIEKEQENVIFSIKSPISHELKVDQSLAHNGVCLTVTSISEGVHTVTAIQETLRKSNLGDWQTGSLINLERSMPANGRFDGHIVQGHVDQVGECVSVKDEAGSWLFTFEYDTSTGNFTVEKGSICINGVSLTVVNSQLGQLSVAIIPYTFEHTNFQQIKAGTKINLEFDILGKYIQRLHNLPSGS